MANTSATGGILNQTSGPISGVDLRRFIGTLLVGVSGLAATLVRPAWQKNPPQMPDVDTNWLAFAIVNISSLGASYLTEAANGSKATQSKHEKLDINLTFYGPDCLAIATAVRDALEITQNTENLLKSKMAVVNFGDVVHAPELVNGHWFDRCDAVLTLHREVLREYAILNFINSTGSKLVKAGDVSSTDPAKNKIVYNA